MAKSPAIWIGTLPAIPTGGYRLRQVSRKHPPAFAVAAKQNKEESDFPFLWEISGLSRPRSLVRRGPGNLQ